MTDKPTQLPSEPARGGIPPKPTNPIAPTDPPPTTKPPVPTQLPTDTPRIAKMKELSQKLGDIITASGGESNIPLNHPDYWTLKAEMNALRSQPEPTA